MPRRVFRREIGKSHVAQKKSQERQALTCPKIEIVLSDPSSVASVSKQTQAISKSLKKYTDEEIVKKVNLLSAEKRSWWDALIKNHESQFADKHLPELYRMFSKFTQEIESMGLNFHRIDRITYQKNLETTLQDMLAVLKKCAPQDRVKQFTCLHQVDLSLCDKFYFIVPEMPSQEDIEVLKITQDPSKIKRLFYTYVAQYPYHLPLRDYEEYLREILDPTIFGGETQCKMAYLLAKTTCSKERVGFDKDHLKQGWENFKRHFQELKSIEQIKANLDTMSRMAFEGVIQAQGLEKLRLAGIAPLLNMTPIPPIGFLFKLLKVSEYKFLDKHLRITDLEPMQKSMMQKIVEAEKIYQRHPESMMKAIKFIKTEEISPQYHPDPEDFSLLENFIQACHLLEKEEILLSLVTTFHLESASVQEISSCLETYHDDLQDDAISVSERALLNYGLSLFQFVRERDFPTKLTAETLNTVQKNLMQAIREGHLDARKAVRLWVHRHFRDYFEEQCLLDMRDEVDIKTVLDEHHIVDEETRASISLIVSCFNEFEEERSLHHVLAEKLIHLYRILPEQEAQFFYEQCLDAMKTGGLLSRDQHDVPPSYLQQFQVLLETLIEEKSTACFTQYMEVAHLHFLEKTSDGKNNLFKCNALIRSWFPLLVKDGAPCKEAFQFAAHLACITPKKVFFSRTDQVEIAFEREKNAKQYALLESKLTQLNARVEACYQQNIVSPADCEALLSAWTEIVALLPEDPPSQQIFLDILKLLKQRVSNNARVQDDFNQQTLWAKAWGMVSGLFTVVTPFEDTLWEARLHELTQPDNPILQALEKSFHQIGFETVLKDFYHKKNQLMQKYPALSARIDNFLNHALTLYPESLEHNYRQFCNLIEQLDHLNDQNLVLSMIYHYSGAHPQRPLLQFSDLVSTREFIGLSRQIQKSVLRAWMTQLNNGVDCSAETVQKFMAHISSCSQDSPVLKYLDQYYAHAPFPPLEKFIAWTIPPWDEAVMQQAYQKFDLHPCAKDNHDGRESQNGFHLNEALQKLSSMHTVRHIFTTAYLSKIEKTQRDARGLSSQELLQFFKTFQDIEHPDHIELVLYAVEYLHRAKGKTPEFFGDEQIPGRSFELNTTQILAILSMLEMGKKVTAEIGTGEGKTRMMMILNVCQFVKGHTIDFLTSNQALAERDYLDAFAFYQSIGAEVNFITAKSPIHSYQMGGIHVSDPENFWLFRNKAKSQKKSDYVLNPIAEKRALLLDEADVTYYDVSNQQYNYATQASDVYTQVLAIYPILMDFFAEEETEALYLSRFDLCRQKLLNDLEEKDPELHAFILEMMDTSQIDIWLKSAYIARNLKYNVDYTIVHDDSIATDLGEKKVASARCLVGSKMSKNGRFADGVHQCLHAELNRMIKNKEEEPKTSDLRLRQALKMCQKLNRAFHFSPESKVVYTSSSDVMLNDYKDGYILAVTGTLGTELEKDEIQKAVGTEFIGVPRHRGLQRIDRPFMILENHDLQLEALVKHILDAREKKQPILMVCKDHNISQEIFEQLQARLEKEIDALGQPHLTRIDAENYRDGNTATARFLKEHGGAPGEVIITTDILGRGIEYEIHEEAKPSGLKILLTYLPKNARDYGQIIGRGGRYGQIGESQLVLNLRDLQQDFGLDHRNRNLYANPESFLTRLQLFSTCTQVLHRLFQQSLTQLLENYTKRFYAENILHDDSQHQWGNFIKHCHRSQTTTENIIFKELEQVHPDLSKIEQAMQDHEHAVYMYWQVCLAHLAVEPDADIYQKNNAMVRPLLLEKWFCQMQILQKNYQVDVDVCEHRKVDVHAVYDATLAGRSAIFIQPHFFERWRDNIQVWRKGSGLLFPNFHAWRKGEISLQNYLSQLPLFHFFIKPKAEIRAVKVRIPSTYAALMKDLKDKSVIDVSRAMSEIIDKHDENIEKKHDDMRIETQEPEDPENAKEVRRNTHGI